MTPLRFFAGLGLVALVATADGIISGVVESLWGAAWGNRADDLVAFGFALYGIKTLVGRWTR
jgi:cellulase/cellobiase CelA1